MEPGKGQARTRSKRALSEEGGEEGEGWGVGPTRNGRARFGLPYLGGSGALIKEIDGRHQEDSAELVRAGLPRNNPPTPASSLARLPSGADSGRQRWCGDVTALPEGPGAETTLDSPPSPLLVSPLRRSATTFFFSP